MKTRNGGSRHKSFFVLTSRIKKNFVPLRGLCVDGNSKSSFRKGFGSSNYKVWTIPKKKMKSLRCTTRNVEEIRVENSRKFLPWLFSFFS